MEKIDTVDSKTNLPYYIFVNNGDRLYLLGKDGNYLEDNNSSEAMTFNDIIDAAVYIEKHGLQRIATIRKVKYK